MLEFREGWKLWLTMDGEVVVNSLVDWHDVQGGVVRIYWHRGCIQQLDIKAYLEILYSISAESITLDATQFYTLHLNVSVRGEHPLNISRCKAVQGSPRFECQGPCQTIIFRVCRWRGLHQRMLECLAHRGCFHKIVWPWEEAPFVGCNLNWILTTSTT